MSKPIPPPPTPADPRAAVVAHLARLLARYWLRHRPGGGIPPSSS